MKPGVGEVIQHQPVSGIGPDQPCHGTIVALETMPTWRGSVRRIAGAPGSLTQRFDVPHGDGDSRQGKRNQLDSLRAETIATRSPRRFGLLFFRAQSFTHFPRCMPPEDNHPFSLEKIELSRDLRTDLDHSTLATSCTAVY